MLDRVDKSSFGSTLECAHSMRLQAGNPSPALNMSPKSLRRIHSEHPCDTSGKMSLLKNHGAWCDDVPGHTPLRTIMHDCIH